MWEMLGQTEIVTELPENVDANTVRNVSAWFKDLKGCYNQGMAFIRIFVVVNCIQASIVLTHISKVQIS